ncbi:DUF4926 domain-containing protein [Pararobbsia alpina]|uniref:DUF4926 domain-containing protein n=1 Tax=Pararobbsia alpina TaxID=621374 RepID=UPI001583C065|nr:DUF4926 domain-containing protein [Pararobbsia alpina]
MSNVNLSDVAGLLEEIPQEGLRAGMKGTVVDIHRSPCLAYEVEFCDDQGRTIALVALLPNQVELVWSRG